MRGDPAFDLAILTRAVRQPFQVPGGFDRLLGSYATAGGSGVTGEHVRLQELAMTGKCGGTLPRNRRE